RVDADVALGQLRRERLDQTDHTGLGGRVVRLAVVARDARNARDPDDRAAVPDRPGLEQMLRDPLRRAQVHVEYGVPRVRTHVREPLVARDAGVVDDDVESSALLL